ncbi:MAG: PKD domain-containing protein [Ignavibacteria bacterium]|nr:PKD domain-containing protein [Ignavibacteria bacterium]MBK7186041.1 PKD domain-containing protein [Ignavibacteria bacterium]MBK7577344.1 PKD domain-containing protein [Ignavibacteria bacterium]MBK9183230.1 PKD domain-containing protein [Ignavibacteria bacterium]MBP6510366.1 PKD domain-containing protein [Candidatus Kapabacteria bacterium]
MPQFTTIVVFLLISLSAAHAQTEYATWVFGTNAGLTFNNGSGGILDTPRVILNLPIDTREGSSTYSHPCVGSLTLYAMGETAFDGTGRVLDNGTVLSGGSSSSQGALWVRDVSRPLSVYLFIPPDMTDVSATGTQHYTLNRAELGAAGRWTMVERDIVLDPRPGSERIAAAHDAAGTGYWVVTQYTDSAVRNIEFVAYHVTMSGIDPVKVTSRFISSTLPQQAGIMKFSSDGRRLAMTSVDDVVIGLYDFDPSTGVVSRQRQITLSTLPEWQRASFCYGLSFTSSGNYLYTSVRALGTDGITRSSIVRLSVPLLNFDQTVAPELIFATTLTNPYPAALQLGPNRKIYFTFNDNVGEMAYTDDFGVVVTSMAHRFPGISQPRLGLPTCIESTFPRPTPVLTCDLPSGTISASDVCEGGCTVITQNIQGSPTQWLWSFPGGRPAVSTDSIPPRVCYDTAGTYIITLTVRNNAGAVQIADTITVRSAPDVDAGPNVSICVGGQLDLSASGAVTYRWSPASLVDDPTSATPRTVPLTQRTVFVVEGTGSDGCVGVDSVEVSVLPPHTITVQVENANVQVGDYAVVPVTVTSAQVGGSVRLTLSEHEGLVWQAPWNTSVDIDLDSTVKVLSPVALVLLNGDTSRTVNANAEILDTCATTAVRSGEVHVEGCALSARRIVLTQPLTVNIVDGQLVVTGDGSIDVTVYDHVGRSITQATGHHQVRITIETENLRQLFVVARSGGHVLVKYAINGLQASGMSSRKL